jgi:hypothetical protein
VKNEVENFDDFKFFNFARQHFETDELPEI